MPLQHVSSGDTAILPAVVLAGQNARPFSIFILDATSTEITTHRLRGPTILGRDVDCNIVLPDIAASRKHLELCPVGDALLVTDLGSSNQTYVNGAPIRRAEARIGDVIRVGSRFLVVAHIDEEMPASLHESALVGGVSLEPARRTIRLIGPTELPVLVLGETGAGKDVAARMLHAASGRSGPFIAVNCAQLPDHLVESELFGHSKGAFTGASAERKGLIALADRGTLFLDEIGELPLLAQAKLLRVLEDHTVRPLGSEREKRIDLRVVSATNRDLTHARTAGTFRDDLYARLAAVSIALPPLRQRLEDLPALAHALLQRAGVGQVSLSADAWEAMLLYSWPGNVREFDNVLRAAATLLAAAPSRTELRLSDLPSHIANLLSQARHSQTAPPTLRNETSATKPDLHTQLVSALAQNQGNVRQAGVSLGLARSHIYRLLKRFQINPDDFRSGGTHVATSEETPP